MYIEWDQTVDIIDIDGLIMPLDILLSFKPLMKS